MKRLLRVAAGLAGLLLAGMAQAQTYHIDSINPDSLDAATAGATFAISGTLPNFAGGGTSLCFYTGYGSTASILPTSTDASDATFTVPASTIQQVPPGQFSGTSFAAQVYLQASTAACDGNYDSAYTSAVEVDLREPVIESFAAPSVPQTNPATNVQPPPYTVAFYGTFYDANTIVKVSWSGGSGSATVHLVNGGEILATLPAGISPTATSVALDLCNHGPSFDYCAPTQTITLTPLASSTGSLSATPSPAMVQQSVALKAQFSVTPSAGNPSGVGAATGVAAFTNGAGLLGTAKLTLDKTNGTLSQTNIIQTSGIPGLPPQVVDVNKDGLPDVVFFDNSGQLHVDLGATPYGGFVGDLVTQPDPFCSTVFSDAVGDVNGDGYPDIVFICSESGGNQTEVLLGVGDGTFGPPTTLHGVYGTQLALGDIDRDGKQDLIAMGLIVPSSCSTNCVYGFAVFKGDGLGNFTPLFTATTSSTAPPGTQFQTTDVDGDGYPDLVVLNTVAQVTNFFDVYANNAGTSLGKLSGGVYTPNVSLSLGNDFFFDLVLGDFNGDGKADLATLEAQSKNAIVTAVNTSKVGRISFTAPVTTTLPGLAGSLSAGDFNGDGFSDLLVTTSTGATVYDSDGAGNFAQNYAGLALTTPGAQMGLAMDTNADGDADAVIVSVTGGASSVSDNLITYVTTGPGDATLNTSFAASGSASLQASWPGNVNMLGSSGTTPLTVNPATSTTSLLGSGSPTEYGQTVTLTASVSSVATGTATGNITFKDGTATLNTITLVNGAASLQLATLTAGPHTLTAVYSGDGVFATSTSSNLIQTVNQAQPTVSWTTPQPIAYGTALTGTQLDATASSKYVTNVLGTFTYSPLAGTVLNAGPNQTLSVTFTPTDTVDFKSATGSTTITVNKVTPTVNWTAPQPIVYGTALTGTQLNATATGVSGSLAGSFVYSPVAGTVLNAGPSQTLSVTFTPTDATDYNTAIGSTTITVTKATPTVNWTAPQPIVYGTALTGTQLNATATGVSGSLPGTFVYAPVAGTVLGAGNSQALSVTFTPTDVTDYTTATGSTTINVTKATPTISWTAPRPIPYGTALSDVQLNATASGINGLLPGGYTYTPQSGTVLNAGNGQALSVTFTPIDTTDYVTATGGTTINVTQATPAITWNTPAAIVVGTPLSATQLNATATGVSGSLAGTFVYTPASGTVLTAGNGQRLSVTFTPTDTVNYGTMTGSTTIDVIALTVSTVAPTGASLGDAAKTITLTGTGFLANSVVQVNNTGIVTTYVSPTSLTAVIPASYFQAVQTLSITVNDPTQAQTSSAVSLAVTASSPTVVFTGPSSTQPATQPTLTFTLTNPYPVQLSGTLTLTFAGAGGVDDPAIQFAAGGRTMSFTIAANSTTTPTIQFQSGTVAGTITVTLALTAGGQTVTPGNVQPIVITLPPAAPSLTSEVLTRAGNVLTVTVHGFSNTREVATAAFHFTAASGSTVADPDLTIPATALFSTWFSDPTSQQYGSTFTYIQNFNLSQDASTIGSVTITLTNSAGISVSASAQ